MATQNQYRYTDPRIEADPEVVAAKATLDNLPTGFSYDDAMDAGEALDATRRRVWEKFGMPFVIDTGLGEYVVYQATEDRKDIEGDVRAGDWLFQPADWQGDTYSASYSTAEAAENAAREWAASEIDSSEQA